MGGRDDGGTRRSARERQGPLRRGSTRRLGARGRGVAAARVAQPWTTAARSSARRCTTPSSAPGSPTAAATASLGCGNPTAVAELREGETVLDLGSGGGIDVLLSARRVGPTGRRLRARHDRRDARARPAQHGRGGSDERPVPASGEIENVPLPAESVDVVISNCVINLSTDKAEVLREIARVLRPGGRVGVSDVVAEDRLSPASGPSAAPGSAASPARSRAREYVAGPRGGRARGRRGRRSRTRSPTACTARSCGRSSRSRRGGSCHSSRAGVSDACC